MAEFGFEITIKKNILRQFLDDPMLINSTSPSYVSLGSFRIFVDKDEILRTFFRGFLGKDLNVDGSVTCSLMYFLGGLLNNVKTIEEKLENHSFIYDSNFDLVIKKSSNLKLKIGLLKHVPKEYLFYEKEISVEDFSSAVLNASKDFINQVEKLPEYPYFIKKSELVRDFKLFKQLIAELEGRQKT